MGMGFGANCADVIEWESICKICPAAARKFSAALAKHDIDMDTAIQSLVEESYLGDLPEGVSEEEALERLDKAFEALNEAFMDKTSVVSHGCTSCLELVPRYHDHESAGDRYDEVEDAFFHVEGVYQLSPAGNKFQKFIERKWFVTFG